MKWSHKKCATLALLYSTKTSVSVHSISLSKNIAQSLEMNGERKKHIHIAHGIQDANILFTSCASRALVLRIHGCGDELVCTVQCTSRYKCTYCALLWIFVFSIRTINMIKAIVSLGFMRKYRFSSKTKQKKHFANFILQFSSNSKNSNPLNAIPRACYFDLNTRCKLYACLRSAFFNTIFL